MKTYIVKKTTAPVTEQSFAQAEVAHVDYSPTWAPCVCPYHMEARVLYTDDALYVNLKTDKDLLFAHQNLRDTPVCTDSCMEFFIAPDEDDEHYMNFEINPLGTLYVSHALNRYEIKFLSDDESIFDIKSVITKDEWQLSYKIPFSFLLKYFKKIGPKMRGNFYKCGEHAHIPHYATWSPITCEKPDFHRPEFFGTLSFEKEIPCI
ncbi:MAG: carbohydrate-binding family 9-like protein [Clostridia bacterium]|nr:carbohydrate-binding family 9-like protein [Clostridia bacterium]